MTILNINKNVEKEHWRYNGLNKPLVLPLPYLPIIFINAQMLP
jgi:hypothetical protein